MKPRIASLSIERFRSLQQLKVEGLGRVNLVTGRNNTGKSSILEALRILASDASPSVLSRILRYREEETLRCSTNWRDCTGWGMYNTLAERSWDRRRSCTSATT